MLEKVRFTVSRHRMCEPGERVAVAVSGGIDSVVLLDILRQIFGPVLVVHLNHGLRAEHSDADEIFVRDLAARWDLPFRSASAVPSGGNLEQEARQARLAFFSRLRSEGVADRIATGHTRSDQAETVLYRILRGSGTAGLSGILPVTREGLIRPLLECSRAEVEAWARQYSLSWRQDHTNDDLGFARNRLRHSVLPALAQSFGEAVPDILAATASLARDEEDYWRREIGRVAGRLFHRRAGAVLLFTDALLDLHPALARRVLRRAFAEVKGDLRSIDLTHVESVLQLAAGGDGHGRVQAPGIDVFRSFNQMRISRPRTVSRFELDYCFPVNASGLFCPPGCNVAIFLEIRPESTGASYNTKGDEVDWDRLRPPVELRNWHPGDEFEPAGRTRRKIKTLFQEARVPIWDRHSWPVLTSAGEIVWTRGFGTANGFLPGRGTRTTLCVYETEREEPAATGKTDVSAESDEAL